MKTLVVIAVLAVLILGAGIVLADVILGALGASSLAFASAAALADRVPSRQPAQAKPT